MKLAALLAATLATTAAMLTSAQAGGVVFNTHVTYTEPVTYAAGVTYLAPVTYAARAAEAEAVSNAVMLERVIVTPRRTYAEREWHQHLASQKAGATLLPVKSERRLPHRSNDLLRVLLPLH